MAEEMGERTLWLDEVSVSGGHLVVRYGVDRHAFSTSLWWEGVDLDEVAASIGAAHLRRLVFHIAAFEAMKAASLRPAVFDLGPYADLGTAAFRELWSTVLRHVWSQWRYEHDLVDDAITIAGPPAEPGPDPLEAATDRRVLLFCGGGKDSLVAARVLEEAGVAYGSYAYSHSTYGRPAPQHALIDGLLDHLLPIERHRHWVFDDLLDLPVARAAPELGARHITAAETPSSIFGVLPLAVALGYTDLVVAHERSADVGNLVWSRTGEEVNHQWGKSLDAERRLRDYIGAHLVAGLSYSSVLKPSHDVLIFRALAESLDAVPSTHSCNVEKPWCLRCAKCAYVWLGYQAFLPDATVLATFGDRNLLDEPANLMWFEQMLGLADHTPFECIGQVDEARLSFELLRRRGCTGTAMRMFEERVPPVDAEHLYRSLIAVAPGHHAMPPGLAGAVVPVLERLAASPLR
ncbi:MAG: hypothetical protein ACJ739_03455 [Acidimicrobiales bacterium]